MTAVPLALDHQGRIALAARCRDCDPIPKVEGAGQVIEEPNGTRVQVMHNGLKVVADGYNGAWMTNLISRCQGHHEPQEERVFDSLMKVLPPDATMIELGSNWAYYSAWFLSGSPQRQAVLLEPDPQSRALGDRNLQLNGLAATVVAGSAGSAPAPAQPFESEFAGTIEIPQFGVEQIAREHGFKTVDLLHCDTQGAELAVLEGCRTMMREGRLKWLMISTHAHWVSGDCLTHQRCLALLREEGAVIEIEHTPAESFSGDGLIFARFGDAPPGWQLPPVSLARHSESLYRDAAYDLADAQREANGITALADRIVQGAARSLLFRDANSAELDALTSYLSTTGDVEGFLVSLLQSPEFASRHEQFTARYMTPEGARLVAADGRGSARFECSEVVLALKADGPLGSKGDTLVMGNDQLMLPHILTNNGWNVRDLAFLGEHIDPSRNYHLLDIGANVGLFSRQTLIAFPNIKLADCVEPDPVNYSMLARNLSRWSTDRARLHNHALGIANHAATTFYRDSENFGNYSLNADAMRDRPHSATTVTVCSAEDWLSRFDGDDMPIIWKSDTQGFDEIVVAAASPTLWSRVQIAMIELWRIRKPVVPSDDFFARVEDMPHRWIGDRQVSTREVREYLDSDDWTHSDLLMWR